MHFDTFAFRPFFYFISFYLALDFDSLSGLTFLAPGENQTTNQRWLKNVSFSFFLMVVDTPAAQGDAI